MATATAVPFRNDDCDVGDRDRDDCTCNGDRDCDVGDNNRNDCVDCNFNCDANGTAGAMAMVRATATATAVTAIETATARASDELPCAECDAKCRVPSAV